MPDYQIMYETLFNAITESIIKLQKAQKAAEEIYISSVQTNDNNSTEDGN